MKPRHRVKYLYSFLGELTVILRRRIHVTTTVPMLRSIEDPVCFHTYDIHVYVYGCIRYTENEDFLQPSIVVNVVKIRGSRTMTSVVGRIEKVCRVRSQSFTTSLLTCIKQHKNFMVKIPGYRHKEVRVSVVQGEQRWSHCGQLIGSIVNSVKR